MSAEKIIECIRKDSEKEVQKILQNAEEQVALNKEDAIKIAKSESDQILSEGKKQAENIKKIIISKANQDAKRKIMNVREKIIEECFSIAHQKLSVLKESEYEKTVTKLIENGKKKIEGQCSVTISREIDKQIAKNMGLRVTGEIESSGGIILISSDGRITLDNTFDGILKRKKNEIRIEVGKLLFSE